jgi:predicted component of type VI protein secretion system
MADSIQHKLDRVRPPRVQITYDVQIGDAFEVKELPLVVGVMADLSGKLAEGQEPPKLRDREFVEIDRDSFKEIFGKAAPRLDFAVDSQVRAKSNDAQPKLKVELGAQPSPKLDPANPLDAQLAKVMTEDPLYMFHPLWVIRHTADLKALYEARTRLTDLLNKLDCNDKLGEQLKTAVKSPEGKQYALDASAYPSTNGTPQLTEKAGGAGADQVKPQEPAGADAAKA